MSLQIPQSWGNRKDILDEHFQSWVDRSPTYIVRGIRSNAAGCNVIRMLTFPEVSPSGVVDLIKDYDYTHNIITDKGDEAYAIEAHNGTLTTIGACSNDHQSTDGRLELRTAADTPAKADLRAAVLCLSSGSRKAIDACYPKNNDCDADNPGCTGVDFLTWRVSYATCEANACNYQGGIICSGGAAPAVCQALLTHFSITSFNKTASDTLKFYVNHQFNGT